MTPDGISERLRLAGNPVADPAAVVRLGGLRVTVLTDRLLRLEWSSAGEFEDRATLAFPNRRAPVPAFEIRSEAGGTTVVDTGALVLRHTPDGRPMSPGNTLVDVIGPPRGRWVPGLVDRCNLGGARRTVDRCRGEAALEPGLVSRSGWAVVDDGAGVLLDPDDGWVVPRPDPPDAQDWYFFGHGHDYPAAVRDYTRFGGPVPLVPRWLLGVWWSRYWAYRDADLRQLVDDFGAHHLPLDVLVVDMDWHLPDSWTGYSWNRELFPDPRGFLADMHARGLRVTLNLHPALGVQPFEDAHPRFAAAMGAGAGETVPFRIADKDFVRNYFELLHHPLEDDGVDFWWIDWQQGRTSQLRGLDPLPWLNHLHFADLSRHPDRRPLIFSRWGGLGSHRYPVGFSGDSFPTWPMLRFLPRYTAAGANVGYGWWSHDIGGHVGSVDPELYVRWVQFGAVSPVLRLHSNQEPDAERRPWGFGSEVLEVAREAFRLRYRLVPYLYTAARDAADTGISVVRPTSWVAPDEDGAYLAREQYLLGESLLVAPVVTPADPSTGLATVDAWLPAGDWIERTTGESFTGPRWVRLAVGLQVVPQFVRPGTVLPLASSVAPTGRQDGGHLVLSVFPGAGGGGRLYDDDGVTPDHEAGEYSWTTFATSAPDPSTCTLRIGPGRVRRWTVRFERTNLPVSVLVDGVRSGSWRHEDDATVVDVPPGSGDREITLAADGPLSALGPDHDRAVRAADLGRLLPHLPPSVVRDQEAAAARALPEGHPSRPAALARIGAPWIRVIEHTTPEEAAGVLGRVVVVAAEHGPPALAEASWRLERGADVQEVSVGPIEVTGDAAVLAAPFAWDGSAIPTRWTVDVTATWGDVVVGERHESALLMPALSAWTVRVAAGEVAEDDTGGWQEVRADPSGIDFPALSEDFVLLFRELGRDRADAAADNVAELVAELVAEPVAEAVTELTFPRERDVSFSYLCGGPVAFVLDGVPLDPDERGPVPYYTLAPQWRRTAPVHLSAGTHLLSVACPLAPDQAAHDWYLAVRAVDPADGHVLVDVAAAPAAVRQDGAPRGV